MTKKKKLLIALIVILLVVVCLVAAPILLVGGPIIGEMLFDKPTKPEITKGEFPFTLVYEYDDKEVTIEETIVCEYKGVSFSLDGGNRRDWNCYITNNDENGRYYLDKEKYRALYIQVPLEADYYMGDQTFDKDLATPYIYFIDSETDTTYYEQDLIDLVGARIISWEIREPLKDNIK